MPWQLWLAGTLGVGGIACGFAFWRWLRALSHDASQAEVVRQQNEITSEVLHDVEEAKKIRERLADDPDFAGRVRERHTRDD